MLKGRLGLETARIPHVDRHGLVWLARGALVVDDGTLRFVTAGWDDMPAGDYAIPFQMVSCICLMPGSTVSHDALRLLARHGTGLTVTGMDGVRLYASMPFGPDQSRRARNQVNAWSDPQHKTLIARRMYAWRLGEIVPNADLDVLRGIEGARVRESYKRIAQEFHVQWQSRRYDRNDPTKDDPVNTCINHASTAVRAAAQVAVAVTGAIPQLGFIHEDSGIAFALDVADLFRDDVTLPVAFAALKDLRSGETYDRAVRRHCSATFKRKALVARMIDRIKELFDGNDGGGDPERPGPG
ncbi:MAG: type I-E CRISPR-associated endonuclease Cas1e [Polyangiales bacterium]